MPASTPPPAQTRIDAVRNRRRLLDAGREALAEGGLDVSIEEIVRRAGFAKGTFFRHFAAKDALVQALLADRLLRLAEIAREVNATHEPGWDALRTMMERFIEHAAADCSISECLGGHPVIGTEAQPAHAALQTEVRYTLKAAQATGEVRPDVDRSDLEMIMMAILGATARLHSTHPHLGRRYVRLFLDGLRSGTLNDLGGPPLGDEVGASSNDCSARSSAS
ncbi:MAG: TetR/AcrR family transcriptional regulator [Candidatus Limnocylindria bacterium]